MRLDGAAKAMYRTCGFESRLAAFFRFGSRYQPGTDRNNPSPHARAYGMTILLVFFWLFLLLAFIGVLPSPASPIAPYSGVFTLLAILMLYFLGHGAHFP